MFRKLLLLLSLISITAFATDVIPPPPIATWKSSVATTGDLPPTGNTAGDARTITTTGALYVWDGTAWVSGGGGGSISLGMNVVGAPPGGFLYTDSSSNLFADNLATRENASGYFNTAINSYFTNSQSTLDQNDTFIITSNTGSNASLVFDGSTSCAAVIAAWNTANPTVIVSQVSGSGSDIPPAQTVSWNNGQDTLYSGQFTTEVGAVVNGVGHQLNAGNELGILFQGNNEQLIGIPGLSTILGQVNFANNNQSVLTLGEGTGQLQFQSGMNNVYFQANASNNNVIFGNNNAGFGVESYPYWSDGTNFYNLPIGTTPTTGQVLGVSGVSGSNVSLGWVSAGSGTIPTGSQYNQLLRWNQGTGLPEWANMFISMADQTNAGSNGNVFMGYNAGGIVSDSFSPSPGSGYANTVIGTYALQGLTTSTNVNRNTVIGEAAGGGSSGTFNRYTALGYQAEYLGTTSVVDSIQLGADNDLNDISGITPITPTGDIAIGTQLSSGGTNNQILANYSQIYGSSNIVMGSNISMTNSSTANNNIIIGQNLAGALVSGTQNLLMGFGGPGNVSSGSGNTLLMSAGNNVTTGNYNVGIGQGSLQTATTGGNNIGIGGGDVLTSSTNQGISIGQSSVSDTQGVAIGVGAIAAQNGIAIGPGSNATPNQFVAGSDSAGGIQDVYFGTGQYANGDYTIHGSESLLPSPSMDAPGGSLNLLAGHGIGAGSGGNLRLGSSFLGTSGTTVNPSFWAFILDPTYFNLQIGDPDNQTGSGTATLFFDYSAHIAAMTNTINSNPLQTWDAPNRVTVLGDTLGNFNLTALQVDDGNFNIAARALGSFQVQNAASGALIANFVVNGTNPQIYLGDVQAEGNSTTLIVADDSTSISLNSVSVTEQGKTTNYNGDNLQGNGLASEPIVHDSTNEVPGASWSNLFYSPGGSYRLSVYATVTTAGLTGYLTPTISFIDDTGASQDINLPNLDLTNVGAMSTSSTFIVVGSGQPINLSTPYTSVSGSPLYNMHFVLERLR